MSHPRKSAHYPDDPAGSFEGPPRRFTDADGRDIVVREYGRHRGADREYRDLVGIYLDFDPEDRAQGIPPLGEDRIRRWLDRLLDAGGYNVIVWHDRDSAGDGDGQAIGHATLVCDEAEAYELAIFVLQAYQNEGIGTRTLETLLGLGERRGLERVWLSVERWNNRAIEMYETVGFQHTGAGGFELTMTLRLAPGGESP